MTGHLRSINSPRKAWISSLCHGPMPLLPTKTAADFMLSICSPSAVCHEVPGLICSSSSHDLMPSLTNFRAISRTAGLSSLLWHRKTSKISALESRSLTKKLLYRKERKQPITFRDQIGRNRPQPRRELKVPTDVAFTQKINRRESAISDPF